MSKILRAALPIAFIVVVYTREPMGTLFGYNTFSPIPLPIWLLLLVALGGTNAASAFALVRTERARHLAFWGLTLKVCFLPIFLVNLFVVAVIGGLSFFNHEALVLRLAIIPSAALSCALMVVSSCYGFAAITRARNEQLISHETAKKYIHGHAIPITDLVVFECDGVVALVSRKKATREFPDFMIPQPGLHPPRLLVSPPTPNQFARLKSLGM